MSATYETRTLRLLRYVLIAVTVLVVMFPLLWMLFSSLRPDGDLFTSPPTFLSETLIIDNYVSILTDRTFLRYVLNSVIVATLTTLVSLILAVMAGYGWAKFEFPGAQKSALFVLVSQMFPIVLLIIPMFEILRQLSLLNSHPGLVFSYLIYTLPLSTWMLKSFFESIPDNLLRAARIDGFSEFQIFREIALPLVLPGIAATAIYAFILSWQEFFFALTFMQDDHMRTLPVALLGFIGQYDLAWGELMAASVVTVLPVAMLFMALQRYFIQGVASGAVKG